MTWRISTTVLVSGMLLACAPAGLEAGVRGAESSDIGGSGADPGNPNTQVRTDRTGMGALSRMMKGGTGESAEVTAKGELSVRSAKAFGPNIIGTLSGGAAFKVTRRDGAWFAIEYPRQPAWVYVTFIEDSEVGGGVATVPGATQNALAVKQASYNILNKVPFPYEPATNGGRLGCAQVVSTILKAAGAMSQILLGVLGVMDVLKSKGWRMVKTPPWKDGDVVTWATYDRTGDGRTDPDTHIGTVVLEGGKAFAVNNSSSRRRPEKHLLSTYPAPVSHVLRMGGL